MDPTTTTCNTSCTVTFVIDLNAPVLNLDVEAAASITLAILVLWAIGFAARMLIRALNVDSGSSSGTERE